MQKLVRLFILLAFTLALGAYVTSSASAQEKSAGGKTTVTGCLQKGDEPGEYSITGEDGKTYGLRSKAVNLSQHLGHKVTITGTLRAESAEKEKGEAEEHEKKEATEAGDIRVADLKMVATNANESRRSLFLNERVLRGALRSGCQNPFGRRDRFLFGRL